MSIQNIGGCAALAVLLMCGCKAKEPPDLRFDASIPDAPSAVDAADGTDGSSPDASGPCPGGMQFTGGYEDWDSTPMDFDGVEFADVTQVDEPGNSVMTAPNGRVDSMCLPSARTPVDFTQSDYLDLRYTAAPSTTQLPFAVRGLQPVRADDLFAQELSLSRDLQAAYATVFVRMYPSGDPVIGATVGLGNGHSGAFAADGAGVFSPGDALVDGSFVLFANVAVDGGSTTVQVTAPAGIDCEGPTTIDLVAGALAATDFVCTGP